MKKKTVLLTIVAAISLICLLALRLLLGGWEHYMFVPLIFFCVSFTAAVWTSRKIFSEFLAVKTTKEGMSMGAMIALTLILVAVLNYFAAKNPKVFDYSSAQINTLSDQSQKMLENLTEDLQVLYFYQNGAEGVEENKKAFIDLLRKYQDRSQKVKLQFVEVNENPQLTQEYGVDKGSGLVFVTYKGRRNKIERIDEQELTGAIVKVSREKDKKVFYTIGHSERNFEDAQEPNSLGALKKLLEGNRYLVGPLNLNVASEVPADADVVVVAGPQHDFLAHELTALEKYLQKGGRLLVALEPGKEGGLSSLFSKLGLKFEVGLIAHVMETPIGKAVNPQVTPVSQFNSDHPITKPFGKNDLILMRLPFPVVKEKTIDQITITELGKTDAGSLAFPNTEFKGAAKPGPHTPAIAISGIYPGASENKKFELLLFSDVDFLNNQLLYKNLNRDLALNSVSYLAQEESVISITPKEIAVTKMDLTPTKFQVFVFGFVLPLPILILASSIVLWYRRRYAT